MNEQYFVIFNSDGDTKVHCLTREELLKRLDPADPYYGDREFLTGIDEADTNYWGNGMLIIKGDIVVPKPVQVVQRYDV